MSDSVLVVWDDAMAAYDFGPSHPLRPLRLDLTIALSRELGVLDLPNVTVRAPRTAGDETLALVHEREYIAAVREAPDDMVRRLRHGLGTLDNPVFDRMHEASALVAGASVDAARAVWSGEAQHAANLAGGLHHAMRDRASGFCVYDDPAVAIAWLLDAGATSVAYVDIDVHHGDGVQAAFYADPRVLTVSLHQDGRTLFPGTGFPHETGAERTSVNVALPPGTGDDGWLRAIDAVALPAVRRHRPEVLVTQLGCDTHALDPLANLACSVDGQRAAYRMLHDLAHEVCAGRWVALGGGGYEIVQVVPRAWTAALAELAGAELPGETPEGWRDYAEGRAREHAPVSMTDGRPAGFTPWTPEGTGAVDRAIAATRKAVRL